MNANNGGKSFGKVLVYGLLLCALVSGLLFSPASGYRVQVARSSYIVQGASSEQAARLVEKYGGEVTSRLAIIGGVGAQLSPAAVAALQKETSIRAITLNQVVQVSGVGNGKGNEVPATDYPDVIGADVVWNQGTIGKHVTVAVVDTGLGWHPAFLLDKKGRPDVRVVGWKDFVENRRLPLDPNGHGTHVAGIIANSAIGSDNEFDGVAPGVNLVGVRVLDEQGFGTYERVIQGVEWVVANASQYNIRVMNLSLVAPVLSTYWADPLNQAVMRAWAAGVVVVAAAGNTGPNAMTVGVPGNNPYVITVGAFTDNFTPDNWNDDYIAPFSASGPTLDGFVKPDVIAPGAHMVSTMMPWSYLNRNHQVNQITPFYFSMAGTSQAAAVVSGVAALILSKNPGLTPNQVKYRLQVTAFPWVDPTTTKAGYSIWQQGFGRLNAADAVSAVVDGQANQGMDIQADLAGTLHYEGYSYFDEQSGTFRLKAPFSDWDGGYWQWDSGVGAWSGGYSTWMSGVGAWSGGVGAWSGGVGAWSGGVGAWSGGVGAWSGGVGAWSGGVGAWSGGFTTWAGGVGAWSGNVPWSGTPFVEQSFVSNFASGATPNASSAMTSVNFWVEEP
jgi:serine protease AprX